ncbi:MAG: DUF1844 domain-containing protein [Phycisphaerae bacterium]|nr:DUF1844 domain-containing protein [Phycisphaerae bacterium]
MTQNNEEKSKIIVDDDWKTQAQAEKEKLVAEAEAAAEEKPQTPASGDDAAGADQPRNIPPASFQVLVNQITMQAIMALGGMEDPETKKRYVDLELAKLHIDTLGVLEEKTKGNLTDEETKLLEQTLHQLQTNFVAIIEHLKQNPQGDAPMQPEK